MSQATGAAQISFVVKVIGLSTLIAIAFKTLAPRLSIPATNAVSLALVLTPSLLLGAFLPWQLGITNTHSP